MNSTLSLKNISKVYQDINSEILAIKDFSYNFKKGEFISIVGPSGCGKSTLLSIISGLEAPTSGSVYIDNQDITGKITNIGYMLQKDYLLEWRNILQNVCFGLEIKNMLNEKTKNYAINLLKTYGLGEFIDKYPAQLSGGMKQRVALIRTLATNPDILLLDEAFSALDYQTRLSVTNDVYQIIKNENITAIMVTHDIPESISMSDKIIVLTQRPAVIKSVHDIKFNIKNRTPLSCREDPNFSKYFDTIWRELN
ncbi:MAG: ABC transporter ATP-binding protein [Clostridiales bacterium]|nr:ABC transporter ATP-binding protein [Clostridiales bacterium]